MTMVDVASGSRKADSQPGSFGLVWGSAAAWRRSTFITWTGWTLTVVSAMAERGCLYFFQTYSPRGAVSYDDSTLNIIMVIIFLIIIIMYVQCMCLTAQVVSVWSWSCICCFVWCVWNVHYVQISVDQESKVHEEKTLKSDHVVYENICRRVVGKCIFLLLAIQPAVLGENKLQMYPNVCRC